MKEYILGAVVATFVAVSMTCMASLSNSSSFLSSVSQAIDWYVLQLKAYPVWTKSITTSIIQLIGDIFAQLYELYCQQHEEENSKRAKKFRVSSLSFQYDIRRGLSLAADGLFLSGPLLHYAFEVMEHVLPTEDGDSSFSMATMWHVLANDYIVDTIYLFFSFIFVAVAEGLAHELPRLIRNDMLDTWKTSWTTSIMLMPVEYFCFSQLPFQFRVLAMNCVDLLWGAIISFAMHQSRRHLTLPDERSLQY